MHTNKSPISPVVYIKVKNSSICLLWTLGAVLRIITIQCGKNISIHRFWLLNMPEERAKNHIEIKTESEI